MRRVFGLATGVYALGIAIRLLQRKSGGGGSALNPTRAARPALALQTDPNSGITTGSPGVNPAGADGSRVAERAADPSQAGVGSGSRLMGVAESTAGETPSAVEHLIRSARSELDPLPRERLFEIAQATGLQLEALITLSREDLIDAVARSGARSDERALSPPLHLTDSAGSSPSEGEVPPDSGLNKQAG